MLLQEETRKEIQSNDSFSESCTSLQVNLQSSAHMIVFILVISHEKQNSTINTFQRKILLCDELFNIDRHLEISYCKHWKCRE